MRSRDPTEGVEGLTPIEGDTGQRMHQGLRKGRKMVESLTISTHTTGKQKAKTSEEAAEVVEVGSATTNKKLREVALLLTIEEAVEVGASTEMSNLREDILHPTTNRRHLIALLRLKRRCRMMTRLRILIMTRPLRSCSLASNLSS